MPRSKLAPEATACGLWRPLYSAESGTEFGEDSSLEEAVSSELVSDPKFPASWENTGNLIDSSLGGASGGSENGHEISFLRANSLLSLTGNFLRPCRELNRAIREVSAVIREARLPPQFGVRPW
jgi:hypothetical protein